MTTPLPFLAVILHACAAAAAVEALVFDVPSGGSKCLTEDLRRGALSHASYRVAPGPTSAADPRISARVTGPRGEELHLAEAAERGELRFRAAEDGGHTACFWTPRYERGAVVSVDVQWDTAGGSGSRPAVAVANNQGPIAVWLPPSSLNHSLPMKINSLLLRILANLLHLHADTKHYRNVDRSNINAKWLL
jgi:hypothetical protein